MKEVYHVQEYKKLCYNYCEPTDQELKDASLRFVHKISGSCKPPKENEQAFYKAVLEIAGISRKLFENINY